MSLLSDQAEQLSLLQSIVCDLQSAVFCLLSTVCLCLQIISIADERKKRLKLSDIFIIAQANQLEPRNSSNDCHRNVNLLSQGTCLIKWHKRLRKAAAKLKNILEILNYYNIMI